MAISAETMEGIMNDYVNKMWEMQKLQMKTELHKARHKIASDTAITACKEAVCRK